MNFLKLSRLTHIFTVPSEKRFPQTPSVTAMGADNTSVNPRPVNTSLSRHAPVIYLVRSKTKINLNIIINYFKYDDPINLIDTKDMAKDNRLKECIHNNSFEGIIVVLLGKLDKLEVVRQDIHMGKVTLWDIMVAFEKDRRLEEGLLFFEPIFINLIIEILQQIKNVILHERVIILVSPIYCV